MPRTVRVEDSEFKTNEQEIIDRPIKPNQLGVDYVQGERERERGGSEIGRGE